MEKEQYHPQKLGIVGGGQLAKMLAMSAKRAGLHVSVLTDAAQCPAGGIADELVVASMHDEEAIIDFVLGVDVATYEMEHISAQALVRAERQGARVLPGGGLLAWVQDKYVQKVRLKEAGVPVGPFRLVESTSDPAELIASLGLPMYLKHRSGGYDGKGNEVIRDERTLAARMAALGSGTLLAERMLEFEGELSILCARDIHGSVVLYPVAHNTHRRSILETTLVPADIGPQVERAVREAALAVMEVLKDPGLFCIEFFWCRDGSVRVNEIAPRPHNTGHYTIEGASVSQYDQLLNILIGSAVREPELHGFCGMWNILGPDDVHGSYRVSGLPDAQALKGVSVHLYGKPDTKPDRKLGHITVCARSEGDMSQQGRLARERIALHAVSRKEA